MRVNMVAPDAVFSHGDKRSGLWAAVGPNRTKARGLDERGLEEYYRSRNLLKARVTAEHVARAVLFFLTHQTPTTVAVVRHRHDLARHHHLGGFHANTRTAVACDSRMK